jgi:cell pole-organizing protein PopZ
MTQPAKSPEPSMEEILASIRRIIADDDANKTVQREAEAPEAATRFDAPAPEPESLSSRPQAVAREASLAQAFSAAPAPAAPAEVDAGPEHASDILERTESMASPMSSQPAPVSSDPAPPFPKIEGHSDVGFHDALEEPTMQSAAAEIRSHYSHSAIDRDEDDHGRLLSAATSAAVDSAFNSLAQTVLVQNPRTLEDLVREMLRPMLKSWLDDNLPSLVERLVRAEIERVSRGRRG